MNSYHITPILMISSASIMLMLGVIHLIYTFFGEKLMPRNTELHEMMIRVSPVITRETTMWNAWVGFNASHSLGAILFGLIYGYLALMEAETLFRSSFLLGVGALMLGGYVVLGKLYWFKIPFIGILASSSLFIASLITNNL